MTISVRKDMVMIISDLGMGGAQRVLSLLATNWADQGYHVQVATFYGDERDHFKLPENVTRVVMGDPGVSRNFVQGLIANLIRIYRVRRMLRASGTSVVISFVGMTNILTVLAGMGAPWKTVISERNDPARQSLGRMWDRLRQWIYPCADHITANSSGAVQTLSRFVPEHKLSLVLNPVDLKRFATDDIQRSKTLLAVGRLVPQKAFDILLSAFAKAGQDLPDWALIIVGDGPQQQELQQQAHDLGIAGRVQWMGRLDDCTALYATVGIFVLASRYEGVPNVLLEAMASGCPVIVSDASSGPLDYVVDGDSGLIVPVEDINILAREIIRLANDEGLRAQLGTSARLRVSANDGELVVAQWSRLIGLKRLPEA